MPVCTRSRARARARTRNANQGISTDLYLSSDDESEVITNLPRSSIRVKRNTMVKVITRILIGLLAASGIGISILLAIALKPLVTESMWYLGQVTTWEECILVAVAVVMIDYAYTEVGDELLELWSTLKKWLKLNALVRFITRSRNMVSRPGSAQSVGQNDTNNDDKSTEIPEENEDTSDSDSMASTISDLTVSDDDILDIVPLSELRDDVELDAMIDQIMGEYIGGPQSFTLEELFDAVDFGVITSPLDMARINQFPLISIRTPQIDASLSCSICLVNFELHNLVKRLDCNHYFHTTCIHRWFELMGTCPVCRFDYRIQASSTN